MSENLVKMLTCDQLKKGLTIPVADQSLSQRFKFSYLSV